MRKNFYLIFSLIILAFLSITACQKKNLFEKNTVLLNNSWHRIDGNHILKFEVPVNDTLDEYNIRLSVKYLKNIPVNNLRIGLTVFTPASEEKYSEHNLIIKDNNATCKGIPDGNSFIFTSSLINKYRFNKNGVYRFEIENLMNKFETNGIMQIGLKIDRND